jgi:methyl-accepting chemotaxis protein
MQNPNVKAAREQADVRIRDWSNAGLKILKPTAGGLTAIPTTFALTKQGDDAVAAVDDLVEMVAANGFDYRAEAEATVEAMRTTMLGIATVTVLIGLSLAAAFAFSFSRPISAAMQVAERVAEGNLSDRINLGRRDELGRLLKSLAIMQANLKARADEELTLMSSKDQTAAEQLNRRKRIEAEIEAFRSTVTSVLTNTDRMTGELTETAQTLSSIARAAGQQSAETASTADATSANVQTVAAATSQLGDSVQAIKGKIHDATQIVQRASGMAGKANETMGALASSAQHIDEVVGFIRNIAGQTNLLALNATIEAARAGEDLRWSRPKSRRSRSRPQRQPRKSHLKSPRCNRRPSKPSTMLEPSQLSWLISTASRLRLPPQSTSRMSRRRTYPGISGRRLRGLPASRKA